MDELNIDDWEDMNFDHLVGLKKSLDQAKLPRDLKKENFDVYTLSDKVKEKAFEIAKKRRDFHRSYNTTKHWHDEDKGEYQDEYWGVLGEIVYRLYIKEHNLNHISEFPPIFTTNPQLSPKYDAKILDKTIEIKAIPPDSNGKNRIRLMIKESEFHNDDYFIAIKFWDNKTYSFCGYLTLEEVLESKTITLKYSRGYSFYLSELPHKMTKNFYKSDHNKITNL